MSQGLISRAKQAAQHARPASIAKKYSTKRLIERFADQLGLVYFGHIDQNEDSQYLVRGVTVSHSHRDRDYCVGSFKGYDVALVIRRDSLTYPDKRVRNHSWLIMTFDLKAPNGLPDVYVSPTHQTEILLAKYTKLSPLTLTNLAPHSSEFMQRFTVFGLPEYAIEIERLFSPDVTVQLPSAFSEASIELSDNTLYLYLHEKHPTKPMLDQLIVAGAWLASMLDHKAKSARDEAR